MSCLVSRESSRRANRDDHIDATFSHQLLCQCRQPIGISRAVPKLKPNIPSFNVTKLGQEPSGRVGLRRNADRPQLDDVRRCCNLLGTCNERPA